MFADVILGILLSAVIIVFYAVCCQNMICDIIEERKEKKNMGL